MSNCNCIETVNKKLAEHNIRVEQSYQLFTTVPGLHCRTVIATKKIDASKRKKPPVLMATFCPFCGVREIPEAKEPTND